MIEIILAVITILEAILFLVVGCFLLLKLKRGLFPTLVILIIMMAAIGGAMLLVYKKLFNGDDARLMQYAFPVAFAFSALVCVILFKEKPITWLFVICFELIVYLYLSFIAKSFSLLFKEEILSWIMYLSIRAVLFVLFLLVQRAVFGVYILNAIKVSGSSFKSMTIINLIYIAFMLTIMIYPTMYYERQYYNYVVGAASFAIWILIEYFCIKNVEAASVSLERERQIELFESNLKYLEQQVSSQNAAIEEVNRTRHDIHHHLIVLSDLIDKNENQQAKEYLSNLVNVNSQTKILRFCENFSVNSILCVLTDRCEKMGIHTEIKSAVPNYMNISDIEIASVFANAYENAIEACLRVSKRSLRFIEITSRMRNGKLSIEVINSCANKVIFEDGYPVTQKKDGGRGTKIIRRTVEKYNGMVDYVQEDDRFITRILLPAEIKPVEERKGLPGYQQTGSAYAASEAGRLDHYEREHNLATATPSAVEPDARADGARSLPPQPKYEVPTGTRPTVKPNYNSTIKRKK